MAFLKIGLLIHWSRVRISPGLPHSTGRQFRRVWAVAASGVRIGNLSNFSRLLGMRPLEVERATDCRTIYTHPRDVLARPAHTLAACPESEAAIDRSSHQWPRRMCTTRTRSKAPGLRISNPPSDNQPNLFGRHQRPARPNIGPRRWWAMQWIVVTRRHDIPPTPRPVPATPRQSRLTV